ncbi:MAG: hypothetical protein ACRDRG_08535 [Pseudonocardiaceae bacterium]
MGVRGGAGEQIGDDLITVQVLPAAVQQAEVDICSQRTDSSGMPSPFRRPGEFLDVGARGGGLIHG